MLVTNYRQNVFYTEQIEAISPLVCTGGTVRKRGYLLFTPPCSRSDNAGGNWSVFDTSIATSIATTHSIPSSRLSPHASLGGYGRRYCSLFPWLPCLFFFY